MNKHDLDQKLKALGVRADAYSLDGGHPPEAYVLSSSGTRWRVYYSERGKETMLQEFTNEADACEYLWTLLVQDLSTRG